MQFGVVIVTFDRIALLQRALSAYESQSEYINYIIVVDNCSGEPTQSFLSNWAKKESSYKKHVVSLKKNMGGSGGFYHGLRFAVKMGCEWIWVADDDAIPFSDTFSGASLFLHKDLSRKEYSAVCSAVVKADGSVDVSHRSFLFRDGRQVKRTPIDAEQYTDGLAIQINAYSFVGTFLNKQALLKAGLPRKNYFIWWDDTEHSLRMSKVGKIVLVPYIHTLHLAEDSSPGHSWKTYYGLRNSSDCILRHFGIVPFLFFWHWQFQSAKLQKDCRLRKVLLRMSRAAFLSVIIRKFGIHKTFRPGWNP